MLSKHSHSHCDPRDFDIHSVSPFPYPWTASGWEADGRTWVVFSGEGVATLTCPLYGMAQRSVAGQTVFWSTVSESVRGQPPCGESWLSNRSPLHNGYVDFHGHRSFEHFHRKKQLPL